MKLLTPPNRLGRPERYRSESINTKICTTCKEAKPFSDFYPKRNPSSPEREIRYLRSLCKKCWTKRNREHLNNSAARYPEKEKARKIFRDARKSGEVKKLNCRVCGDVKSFGHHEDYSKPLEVIWLCRQHHEDLHHGRLKLT